MDAPIPGTRAISSENTLVMKAVRALAPRVAAETRPDLFESLQAAAATEDRGVTDIACSVAMLAEAGYLDWSAGTTRRLLDRLVTVAEANLPLARLLEGHVNSLRLLDQLGGTEVRSDARAFIADGGLFGVWGADGAPPLSVAGGGLAGSKRFASGLGTVGRAIVTLGQGDAVRLAVLDVSDPARHRPETWAKTGMRATVSGDFDAEGMPAAALEWIGGPGQYLQEPGFIGGVWRIAAVQLGGTLGLLKAASDTLAAAGRLEAEPQVARLAPVLSRALAAGAWLDHVAAVAEGPAGAADPELAASLSAQARLLTEEIGQDAIAAVERSVGLAHFDETATTGRIARDLATYMRQAARDALLQRSGARLLGRMGRYSDLLSNGTPGDA